ncbi:hypothetical protein AAur_pTC20004 (plasmid) [Paenarthrobacter aurescens TC1]|uniref:Uncharacterized protein n=1 Tax=Paenarthrobacter aurescens (strain TC1) TaxID=290340 RepID=A1RD58_PAEAT|nr:hypothetical protein AAur_pTC20004 [Paenarthrobacter aurescens TC1]
MRPISCVVGWCIVLETQPGDGEASASLSIGASTWLSAGAVVVLMGLSLGVL